MKDNDPVRQPTSGGTKTLSVPDAGRIYFGIGRNASYAAAQRREIPTLKIGARLRVPVAVLERMLIDCGVTHEGDTAPLPISLRR